MSVVALLTPPVPVAQLTIPSYTPYRFSVEQYDRMVATGILGADDRIELLEGCVVLKMSREPPHDGTVGMILKLLMSLLPGDWELRCQCAVSLPRSKPEPDFAIVRGPLQQYMKRHPRVADLGLLIEVADSTLMSDRRYKGQLYADARVPEYWLVNLVEGIVEVYTQPRLGKTSAYRKRQDYQQGEQVPLRLDGRVIAHLAVSDICPVTA